MQSVVAFFKSNKDVFEAVQAVGAVVNLVGWLVGGVFLWIAWRRNAIKSVAVGPIQFQVQEAAVAATMTAARDWSPPGKAKLDIQRIRSTVARAFSPQSGNRMIGKSVLWVDDNPRNNRLAMIALRRLQLDVEQVLSTEEALAHLQRRPYDLVISDMGRGSNLRAGYDLLDLLRGHGDTVPFFIFSSSDKPEHRKEAAARGAQLSTNDMIELVDKVIDILTAEPQAEGQTTDRPPTKWPPTERPPTGTIPLT